MFNKAKTLFLFVGIIFNISGCNSTSNGSTFPEPAVTIQMDVENGSYESLAIDYWKTDYDVCFDVKILKTYSKIGWGGQVAWLLSDNEGNTLKVYFANTEGDKLNLVAEFIDKDSVRSNHKILHENLDTNKTYSSKFSFNDPYELTLGFQEKSRIIKLPFIPKAFVINASGVKAQIGYSSVKCDIS